MAESTLEGEKLPLRKLIRLWLLACQADGLANATLADYQEKVFKFQWWATTHHPELPHPKQITESHMIEFVAYLRAPNKNRWNVKTRERLAPESVKSYALAVKVFFGWLVRKRHIKATPFTSEVKISNPHKTDRLIKTVPAKDLTRLMAYLAAPTRITTFEGKHNLALITLLLDSGIRRGEALSMTLTDLDIPGRAVRVDGKTGKRQAPFSALCGQLLASYAALLVIKPEDALWRSVDNIPLSIYGFSSIMRSVKVGSGVNFTAHRLRHTYASMLAAQHTDAFSLMRLLGHSKIETTLKYINLNYELASEQYAPKSPLNKIMAQPNPPKELTKRMGRPPKNR